MKHPFVRTLVAASVSLALAVPAHAALERLGPVNNSPTVGGFPAWVQDKSGVAIEFCDMQTQSELDGGWCTLIPPGPIFPEHFPDNYFIEHWHSRWRVPPRSSCLAAWRRWQIAIAQPWRRLGKRRPSWLRPAPTPCGDNHRDSGDRRLRDPRRPVNIHAFVGFVCRNASIQTRGGASASRERGSSLRT